MDKRRHPRYAVEYAGSFWETVSTARVWFLRYRTVKAERLDSAMAKLDAAINTPVTPAKSQLANSLTN